MREKHNIIKYLYGIQRMDGHRSFVGLFLMFSFSVPINPYQSTLSFCLWHQGVPSLCAPHSSFNSEYIVFPDFSHFSSPLRVPLLPLNCNSSSLSIRFNWFSLPRLRKRNSFSSFRTFTGVWGVSWEGREIVQPNLKQPTQINQIFILFTSILLLLLTLLLFC